MAIFPDFPGLTLSIKINHRDLPEYRDDDIEDPPRTISYLVEAIPDSIFSIHANAAPETNFQGSSLALYFYVDGKYVDGTIIDAASVVRGGHGRSQSQGRYVRHDMLRKYQFASRERQIELVEKKSTSLSSRPRASKTSSKTPDVSYSNYDSAGITSAAPTAFDSAADTLTSEDDSRNMYRSTAGPGYRSHAPPSPEEYHSVAAIHPDTYHSVEDSSMFPATTTGPALPLRLAVEASLPKSPLTDEDIPMIGDTDYAIGARRTPIADLGGPRNPSGRKTPARRPWAGAIARKTTAPMSGLTPLSRPQDHAPFLPRTRYVPPAPTRERYQSRTMGPSPAPYPPPPRANDIYTSVEATPSTSTPALSTAKDPASATAGSDFTDAEQLGTIKIVVCHVDKKETVAFGRNASTTAQIATAKQEAVKDKSGGLLVRFTAPQTVSPITTWNVGAVNNDDEGDNSVTYLYHYRTREMLDALGVLPKEVSAEERVKPPFTSSTAATQGSDVAMSDSDGAFLPKRKMNQTDGSRTKEYVPEDADIEEEPFVDEKSVVGTTEAADDDWEMVTDDRTGA